MSNAFILNKQAIKNLYSELADNLEDIGKLVESSAKQNLESMGAVKTGKLKDSITHETDRNNLSVEIGTSVEYAEFVEFGTVKMGPRPFLRRALYENEKEIINLIKK